MSDHTSYLSLGEVSENVSRPFNFSKYEEVVFINTGDVLDGKFINKTPTSKVGLPGQAKKKILKGDLLFSEIRPANRRFARVDFSADNFVVSTKFMVIRANGKIDPNFLYIFLSQQKTLNELQHIAESRSGTFPQITFDAISHLKIPLPPNEIQKDIVNFIESINYKIENNSQMNEKLEEMARAIFKSWFVDFDPVHAKCLGKAPAHMDADTAALFPSSFDDDGLPIGFTSKTLKDNDTELESGKRPKGGIDKSLDEGIPSIGAESLQKIGEFEYSKVKFVGKEFAEKSSKGWVQNYDVAIYKDGANVGDSTRVGLFGNGFPFDKFMVNEHVFLLRSKELGQPFLYSLCQSEMLSNQLKSMGTSKAAQPGLNQQEILSCKYIAPPKVLSSAFNKLTSPFINRRLALGLENQTLTQLRDTLLPKLMSGVIDFKDAEREVEAAV